MREPWTGRTFLHGSITDPNQSYSPVILPLGAHSATLNTFEWQAQGFYVKQGYEEFGRIDNYIKGFALVHLKKALGA